MIERMIFVANKKGYKIKTSDILKNAQNRKNELSSSDNAEVISLDNINIIDNNTNTTVNNTNNNVDNQDNNQDNNSNSLITHQEVISLLSNEFSVESNKQLDLYLEVLNNNYKLVKRTLTQHLNNFLKNKKSFILEKAKYHKNYYLFPILYFAYKEEQSVFPIILKAFTEATNNSYYLFEDLPSNDLATIIYKTFNGDHKLLLSFINDKDIDETSRSQALMAFFKLGSEKKIHPNVLNYFVNSHLKAIEDKEPSEEEVDLLTQVAVYIAEFHIFPMIDKMRKIVHSEAFDQSVIGEYDNYIDRMFTYDGYSRVTNIIEEYSFVNRVYVHRIYDFPKDFIVPESQKISEKNKLRAQKKKEMMDNFISASKVDKSNTIGKNEPCFCNSGKLYKNCCMNKPGDVYACKRFEDYFDLLIDYPNEFKKEKKNDLNLREEKGLAYIFPQKAIEMDKLFFKALHNYMIPSYIPHDYQREGMEKAAYLLEGLDIAYEIIQENKVYDEEEFASKYMIHYNIFDCSNKALKIIQDEHYPQPQFKQRITDLIMLINKHFN